MRGAPAARPRRSCPCPGSLAASMRPPCARAISRASGRPRPKPGRPCWPAPRSKRSKISGSSLGGDAGAVVRHAARRPRRRRAAPRCGRGRRGSQYFTALSTRFENSWRSHEPSPSTATGGNGPASIAMPRSSAERLRRTRRASRAAAPSATRWRCSRAEPGFRLREPQHRVHARRELLRLAQHLLRAPRGTPRRGAAAAGSTRPGRRCARAACAARAPRWR